MAFPNLECASSQSYVIPATSTQVLLNTGTTLSAGLYYVTFSEDLLSPTTQLGSVVAGASFVNVNQSGATDFFTANMPIGSTSTTVANANSVTLLVLPTEVKIENTRASASAVAVFVYKFA